MRKEEEKDLDYDRDITINKFQLDVECENQPNLYMKYAQAAAEAKKEFDEAWEAEKIIKAELIKDATGTAQEKEAFYRTHPKHKKAKERKIKAEYNYNILNAAVFGFSQRKAVLEMLVKLWAGDYFSTPVPERIPREKLEEDKSKKARRKIKTKRRDAR